MARRDPERLRKLRTQNQLKKRAAVLVGRWATKGISASSLAHDRYWLLLDKLRNSGSGPVRRTEDLLGDVASFLVGSEIVKIIGWDAEREPALLVSADKVLATLPSLDQVYPDGFVLIREAAGKALLVDFDDEEGAQINTVHLPAPVP